MNFDDIVIGDEITEDAHRQIGTEEGVTYTPKTLGRYYQRGYKIIEVDVDHLVVGIYLDQFWHASEHKAGEQK